MLTVDKCQVETTTLVNSPLRRRTYAEPNYVEFEWIRRMCSITLNLNVENAEHLWLSYFWILLNLASSPILNDSKGFFLYENLTLFHNFSF